MTLGLKLRFLTCVRTCVDGGTAYGEREYERELKWQKISNVWFSVC